MSVNTATDAPRRGRPPRISTSQIVASAIDIGLDRFSLDDIADRLGVTTPALYSHVEGRDDILRRAAASVIVDLEPELAAVDDWEEWLRVWADGVRARLGAVGEEVLESVRTSVDEASLRLADRGLRLFADAGFDAVEAAYAIWLALRIACTAGPAGRPSVTLPLAGAQAVSAPPSPEMADAIDRVAAVGGEDSWRFDLDVLIAGLAARAPTTRLSPRTATAGSRPC